MKSSPSSVVAVDADDGRVVTTPQSRAQDGQPASPPQSARASLTWRVVAGLEVGLATVAVVLDLFIPTLVVIGLTVVSLLVRREGLGSLGLQRVARPLRMVVQALGLAAAWTLVTFALTKPVLEHVSGQRQDMSAFEDLQGNLGMLLILLVLSWTLAAFAEEVAFRGLVLTRMIQLFGTGAFSVPLAVLFSSVIFGFLHTEYGPIGVVVSAIDAVFYSLVRYHYRSLWAAVCTHGFIDTIGMISVFVVGPIYGLW